MRQVSETTSKYTVFPALILVYTVIVTDQRKRNTLVNLGLVNLGFSWGVFDESTYPPTCDTYRARGRPAAGRIRREEPELADEQLLRQSPFRLFTLRR